MTTSLIRIADSLQCSAARRHLLFISAAAISILLVGYHFGVFDQSIHIPFLKKDADPSLYPANEGFFRLRFQHYSYFWFLFLPFLRIGILEEVLFAAHILATYLTFWAVWRLSITLFRDPLAGLISVVCFVVPHIGFSGFPTLEWSLLNRTAVLPFLLWTLDLYLRQRYWQAFLLLGILANFHVLSAAFLACLFILHMRVERPAGGWRALPLLIAGASPVLLWRLARAPQSAVPAGEWFSIISRGMFYHLFHLVAVYPYVLLITASGLSALILYGIASALNLSPAHDRTVRVFVAGVLLIIAAQIFVTHVVPIAIVIQAQITRVGLVALILGYLYFSGYLASRHRSGDLVGWDFRCLLTAAALGVTPLVPLAIWIFQRVVKPVRWRRVLECGLLSTLIVTMLLAIHGYHFWVPGIYVHGRSTPWRDAQDWARNCTPRDANFITPLHLWWPYESEWRVFSERSQVAALSDLLVIALVPDYVEEWKQRFEALAPGALGKFRGDYFENVRLTKQAYQDLTDDQLRRVAKKYGATYVVIEKPHSRAWLIVYENEQFVIYRIAGSS